MGVFGGDRGGTGVFFVKQKLGNNYWRHLRTAPKLTNFNLTIQKNKYRHLAFLYKTCLKIIPLLSPTFPLFYFHTRIISVASMSHRLIKRVEISNFEWRKVKRHMALLHFSEHFLNNTNSFWSKYLTKIHCYYLSRNLIHSNWFCGRGTFWFMKRTGESCRMGKEIETLNYSRWQKQEENAIKMPFS